MQPPNSWSSSSRNQYKPIISLVVLVLIVTLFSAVILASKSSEVRVMPYPIVLFGDRLGVNLGVVIGEEIYLPLRQMAALLGLQVDFRDNTILVQTQSEAITTEAVSLQTLSASPLTAIPSFFPFFVDGARVEPNPAVLIEGHTYLPLYVFNDYLSIEASFADNMVLLGDYASLADRSLPLVTAEAQMPVSSVNKSSSGQSVPIRSGLERFSVWDAEHLYPLSSLEDFKQLIDLMADNLATEAKIKVGDENLAHQCVGYLQNYTPERFANISVQIKNGGGWVSIGYRSTDEVRAAMQNQGLALSAEAKALREALLRGVEEVILPGMSDYEKEKAIHDYLVHHIEYDLSVVGRTEPHASSTAYGALVLGKAVCGGYAEAFKLFMDLLDIECHIVVGSGDGIPHAWNLIKLDGEYYHLDVTWDDPLLYDEKTGMKLQGSQPKYSYFNLSDNKMALDHTWERADYPAASGEKYCLTRFYSDQETLVAAIDAALAQGEDMFSGRCLFLGDSQAERQSLLNHIMERVSGSYGVRSVNVTWDEHKALHFTFLFE